MAKLIGYTEKDSYSLEVYECECGFHIGIDATFLDQVSEFFKIECPSCGKMIEVEV